MLECCSHWEHYKKFSSQLCNYENGFTCKKTDSNGTLYVNLAETILLDRSSIQCRAHYTVMTIFECAFIICLSLCVFLFLSNLLCFFRFHSMENVNDSVNLHANSQFHGITANFLVPIFCSLSSIC